MDPSVNLTEFPRGLEHVMIAGWNQWADAGEVSSSLPRYLIELLGARKIGEIDAAGFYLFQIPGTHHLLRPEVKLVEGHPVSMTTPSNEIWYAETGGKGLVIFIGEEPHKDEERYAEAFFDVARAELRDLAPYQLVCLFRGSQPVGFFRADEPKGINHAVMPKQKFHILLVTLFPIFIDDG